MGFLFLAIATAALLMISEALVRHWNPEPADSDPVLLLLVFTLLQSLAMLAAGLLGLLKPLPLAVFAVALLVVPLAFRMRPDRTRWLPGSFDRRTRIAAAVFALHALIFAAKGLILIPYWGDAVSYHLPKLASWMHEGRFHWPVGSESRQWFPAGFELVELWWVSFPKHDLLIEWGGLQMALLAAFSLRSLARAHGADPDLALLVYAFMPIFILHVTATGNDLAVGALLLSAFALLADRSPRVTLALPLLLGAGVKPSFLFALGGLFVYALRAGTPPPLKAPRRLWIPLLAGAVVLGGFWYARNHVVKGHALYPVYAADRGENTLRFSLLENLDVLRRTLEDFPRRMHDRRPFTAFASATTAWGWFVLPAGLPLLLLGLRSDPHVRRLAVAFTAGAFPVIALSPLSDLNLRFALWYPALFALAAARLPSRPVWAAAAAAAVLNFSATLVPPDSKVPPSWERPRLVPKGAPIAVLGSEDSPSYRLHDADFSRPVHYPSTWKELRASKVKYVQLWQWPDSHLIHAWRHVEGRIYEAP